MTEPVRSIPVVTEARWPRLLAIAVGVLAVVISLAVVLLAFTWSDARSALARAEEARAAALRAGTVSSCQGQYRGTAAVHDAAVFDAALANDRNPSPANERRIAFEIAAALEMNRRALGVSELAAAHPGQPFECPDIPRPLQVTSTDPTLPYERP